MMLRAEQTPDKTYLEKQGEDYNLVDWYLDVLRKHKDEFASHNTLCRCRCLVLKGEIRG